LRFKFPQVLEDITMKPAIETLFHEAENRYMKPDTTAEVNQYMASLKERTGLYRTLRDQEIAWMQPIADDLEKNFPSEQVARLENSLRNALLSLRHCAMAMLMDDPNYLDGRFLNWFTESVEIHGTLEIDSYLHTAMRKQLSSALNVTQFRLLTPHLDRVQSAFETQTVADEESLLTVAGLF
jgi:Phycobilisome protein